MSTINVFYQGDCVEDIGHAEAKANETLSGIRQRLIAQHGAAEDTLLFCEDQDEPASEDQTVEAAAGAAGAKLHLHRCRRIIVIVHFCGQSVTRKFGPGTTVARAKRWAARREFGMSKEEAGEHVLQITGTHERPAPGTHIGRLARYPDCEVSFDLVPDERINGAPGFDQEGPVPE